VRQDGYEDGVLDVIEALVAIQSGHIGAGGGTDFDAALTAVIGQYAGRGKGIGEGNLLFLSDGAASTPDPALIGQLNAGGVSRKAVGVGEGASLSQLQAIDADAVKVLSSNELINFFLGVERPVVDVPIFVDLDGNGVRNGTEPEATSSVDNPFTIRANESGGFMFTSIPGGTQAFRVGGAGWSQTTPPQAIVQPVIGNFVLVGVVEAGSGAEFAAAAQAAGLQGGDALPMAIPFEDGIQNLLKYAFNMDLSTPDTSTLIPGGDSGLPAGRVHEDGGQTYWRFEFVCRRGAGLTYTPVKSTDLSATSFEPMVGQVTESNIDADWKRVTVDESCDPATISRCYSRVIVGLP